VTRGPKVSIQGPTAKRAATVAATAAMFELYMSLLDKCSVFSTCAVQCSTVNTARDSEIRKRDTVHCAVT
jgi:hypothetical protein